MSLLGSGRSDLRQTGRESCSIQRHPKPAEAVAILEMDISHSASSVIEHKEVNMKETRSIRRTGITVSKLKVSLEGALHCFFVTALLVLMVVGNHSA